MVSGSSEFPSELGGSKRRNEAEKTTVDDEPENKKTRTEIKNQENLLKSQIEEDFQTKMPSDFFEFWDFCKLLNKAEGDVRDVLKDVTGFRLVGPFNGFVEKVSDPLVNWRYYYDPPEFQTLLAKMNGDEPDEEGFHLGYFRDDPNSLPVFVGGNKAGKTCKITQHGQNLFGAFYNVLTDIMNGADPFRQTALQKLREKLHTFTSMKLDYPLEASTSSMKNRDRKRVCSTFHGAGLVVPYNKETMVGYREIPESDASLKKIFQDILDDEENESKMEVLQELVTNVQFANDEGDPGMGLELGLDLLSFGGDVFHPIISNLLSVGYTLLKRQAFANIIEAHLSKRSKGLLVIQT